MVYTLGGRMGCGTMLTIEFTEDVGAPLRTVWTVVADVLRQCDFVAYEIAEARQTNACDMGPDFKWHETGVLLGRRYDCDCVVFGWEPPQWFCFGTKDLFHVSYELEAVPSGTRIFYRCELPQTSESRRDAFTDLCRQSVRNLKRKLEPAVARPGF